MTSIKEVHVLNHTHWDREWYETFEEFRYKLRNGLRYIQDLLERGAIEHFFLDGQTIVLDDYKEIVSEKEYGRLVSFIKQGKIEAGPWYLLADEFLVSGESILKNLEIGIEKAAALTSSYHIGYLPDTFGHNSQMPQIFRGYGIEHAIVWRGAVSETFENTWEGPDGSKVLTFVLPLMEGYYQTFLKHHDYIDKTKGYLESNEPYLTHGHALIMNGADHTFTAPDLGKRISRLNEECKGMTFKQSLLSDYAGAFKGKEPVGKIEGEQRDPSKIFILPGVLSTRSYLKQQNQLCEDLAVSVMEAINVWTNGNTESEAFIEYIWKLILQNQPHDSICGCSVDEVHREMETRTQKVLSGIRQFSKDTLNTAFPFEYLNEKVENPYLYVINNTPITGVYPVKAQVRIPAALDLGGIKLFLDEKELSFDLVKREKREEFLRHILAEPHYAEYAIYDVAFTIPFDGAEIKRVRIERVQAEAKNLMSCDDPFIENEFYKIEWTGHGLTITDLEDGKSYPHQNEFVSSLDAGDTYNYSPPVHDVWNQAVLTKAEEVIKGSTYQSVTLQYELKLPASLNEERTGPYGETVNKIKTTVTLHKGKRLISFSTKVKNTAKDQKLRVGFASGKADFSYGDTPFDVIKRKTIREKNWDAPKNKEAVMNQHPTYSSVIANDHLLVHRGLQEYEIDQMDEEDYAFLTMIRSVGWLSRRDLRTRGNGAGPGFETLGAQCIGTYEFDYGLVLGGKNHSFNTAKLMRNPILTQQSYVFEKEKKLFSQSSSRIVFSSFRQKEKDSFDIRLFNPDQEEHETELQFGFEPASIEEINFAGNVLASLEAKASLVIALKPKQIKTIRIKKNGHNSSCSRNEGEEQ